MIPSTEYFYVEFDKIFEWNLTLTYAFNLCSSITSSTPTLLYELSKVIEYTVGVNYSFDICSWIIWSTSYFSNDVSEKWNKILLFVIHYRVFMDDIISCISLLWIRQILECNLGIYYSLSKFFSDVIRSLFLLWTRLNIRTKW